MISGMLQKLATENSIVELKLSRKATTDLAEIADYIIGEFSVEQARRYRDGLEGCFNSLCDNPFLVRSSEELAPKLRRIRQQAHTISYLPSPDQILIVRVLYHRRDFPRHL